MADFGVIRSADFVKNKRKERSYGDIFWGLRRKPTQKGILGPTLAEKLTMAYMKKV